MPSNDVIAHLEHARLGPCDLIRIEGTSWIVRDNATNTCYRFPSESRRQFRVIQKTGTQQPQTSPTKTLPRSQATTPPAPVSTPAIPVTTNSRSSRQMMESLRIGLPSLDGSTRHLAVGFRQIQGHIVNMLSDVAAGGKAMVIKGSYGQGKTFALRFLEDMALEAGFATVRTEVDAAENRLSKPDHIYRDLMRHLRLPNVKEEGVRMLAVGAEQLVRRNVANGTLALRYAYLDRNLGCFPLAWLLCDSRISEKPELLGLLACDPNYPVSRARQAHEDYRVAARNWPAFSAGTQGDFASYILSGIGRLVCLLGYKGLIVILDEMEKFQDLSWSEQTKAGNLLGGLIYAATADVFRRKHQDHIPGLSHSHRCGGYPFTTPERCNLGIAIAMTPRGDEDLDTKWSDYGMLEVAELPHMSKSLLTEYCGLVAPHFAKAYGLTLSDSNVVNQIALDAVEVWRKHGVASTRSAVQAAIAAFDQWRDRACFR